MKTVVCTKLLDVSEQGIVIECGKEEVSISFADCVKNFSTETGKGSGTCVAARDVTELTFTFYTDPKTIVSVKKGFFQTLLTGKTAYERFSELRKAIEKAGYSSYDLS